MTTIITALILILLILLFSIFAAWLDKFGRKHKEEFLTKPSRKSLTRFPQPLRLALPW